MSTLSDVVDAIGKDALCMEILSIDSTLRGLSLEEHDAGLDLLVSELDSVDSSEIRLMLFSMYRAELVEQISELKVAVNPDTTEITVLHEIFKFLAEPESILAKDTAIAIIEDSTEPNECLSDLLELHYNRPSIEYMDVIVSVRGSLIDEISNAIIASKEVADDEVESLEGLFEVKPNIISWLAATRPSIVDLLTNGFKLGFSFDTYMKSIFVNDPMEYGYKSNDQITANVVAAILISKEGISILNNLEKRLVPHFGDNVPLIADLCKQVPAITMGIYNNEQG